MHDNHTTSRLHCCTVSVSVNSELHLFIFKFSPFPTKAASSLKYKYQKTSWQTSVKVETNSWSTACIRRSLTVDMRLRPTHVVYSARRLKMFSARSQSLWMLRAVNINKNGGSKETTLTHWKHKPSDIYKNNDSPPSSFTSSVRGGFVLEEPLHLQRTADRRGAPERHVWVYRSALQT